jgi:hypothetical protein
MPRRKIPIIGVLAVAFLAAIAANAMEFWDSKNWNKWSKDACEKLLTESPWAHSWTGVYSATLGRIERPQYGIPGPTQNDLVYLVQIRSALPVREAAVREEQLSENYSKMTVDKRKVFDAWAARVLNQTPEEPIIVRVDLTRGADLDAFEKPGETLHISLVADDGAQISATSVQLNRSAEYLDVSFPRVVAGAPAIKLGQKSFSIEFESPPVSVTPAQSVKVKFDLSKMLVNGKPNF